MERLRKYRVRVLMTAGIFLCLMSTLPARSDGPYRTFTNTQERTFDGRILAFNAIDEAVSIERSDGKTGQMPLSMFSEGDRQYIRDWGVTNDFFHGIKIGTLLRSSTASVEETDLTDVTKQVKDYRYDVQLRNTSTTAFKEIDIDYCIFYRQGERDGYTTIYDEGICYGKVSDLPLAPDESKLLETKSVRLYSASGYQTMFGTIEMSDAEIRGIWLRMVIKGPSGKKIMREYRTADDDLWKWTPHSVGAGLNPGSTGTRYFYTK